MDCESFMILSSFVPMCLGSINMHGLTFENRKKKFIPMTFLEYIDANNSRSSKTAFNFKDISELRES
jgi:hypothetical protein